MDSIRQLNIFYSAFIICFNILLLFVRPNGKIFIKIKYVLDIVLRNDKKRNINVFFFFIIVSDSVMLGDLKIACGVKYIPLNQDMCLSNVPDICTSIIVNCNDFPGK